MPVGVSERETRQSSSIPLAQGKVEQLGHGTPYEDEDLACLLALPACRLEAGVAEGVEETVVVELGGGGIVEELLLGQRRRRRAEDEDEVNGEGGVETGHSQA